MEIINNKKHRILRCFYLVSRFKPFSVFVDSFEPIYSFSGFENGLNSKPTSTRLYSCVFSNGLGSVGSIKVPICRSLVGASGKIRSLVGASGKIRSFSVFTEFENVGVVGSGDSVLEVGGVDENVAKDEIFGDVGSVLVNENVLNVGSKVINVDEDVAKDDSKIVYEIVEAIRKCKDEKLDKEVVPKGEKGLIRLVNEVFCVLNSEKVMGLPLFIWAQVENPKLFHSADFRSLMIDNCGWLKDYEKMQRLLEGFSVHDVCLTEKAFRFFVGFDGDKDLTMESIRKVVEILNKVGGSCRGTGLIGLIKTLCKLDLVEMAMFVIQITEKKLSYYNIIVQENCLRSRFDEARDLVEEMHESNCTPNALSYTYILSALCKNDKTKEACDLLEEMEKKGCKPDALCFEIIIIHMCKLGKMDIASRYFDQMVTQGLEPRVYTNATLTKCYFNSEKYEEAHKFVINLGVEHKSCGTSAYSLLANLYYEKNEVDAAGKLLIEMMDKNFIPDFSLCKTISKRLLKMGQKQLVDDIKARFSKLKIKELHR